MNSTDGAPGTDACDHVLMETDPYDSIQMEDNFMIETEDGEAILLEVLKIMLELQPSFSLKLVHKTQMVFLKLELMEKTNIFTLVS